MVGIYGKSVFMIREHNLIVKRIQIDVRFFNIHLFSTFTMWASDEDQKFIISIKGKITSFKISFLSF